MHPRVLACAVVASTWVACGGKLAPIESDDAGAGSDARVVDAMPVKDVVTEEAGYQTQGTKCVANDAGAPVPWTPTGGGATLRPPIMQSFGGAVLGNPVFVPMTFDGDALRDPIEDFIASVGCTTYWQTTMPDYGVGDAVSSAPVHLTDTPPATIDDSEIAAYIRAKILASEVPAPIPNSTLYVIYYPETTTITFQGQQSCQGFGGYHSAVLVSGTLSVPYAVLPRCPNFIPELAGIDELTGASSHELAEASSDPFWMTIPAYELPEYSDGLAWAIATGGEIGDLCAFNQNAFYQPNDYAFYVQHLWTSHAAYALEDPCQPSTDTYVAAAPVLPDTLTVNTGTSTVNAEGVSIGLGNSKTISLDIIASGTWGSVVNVQAQDGTQLLGGQPALTFGLAKNTGFVGDTLQLTINRIGTNATDGVEPFVIIAQSAGLTYMWWGMVGD